MMVWMLLDPPLVWPWTALLLVAAPPVGWGLWKFTRWYDTRTQLRVFQSQVQELQE
jgi:hypothetical protein